MVLNSIGGKGGNSTTLRIFGFILMAFTLLVLSIPMVNATLVSFRGYVFIDNESAPEETPVAVYASNGTLLQQREVFILDGNAYYILDVDAPNVVFFKVAGIPSLEGLINVTDSGLYRLNLSINSLPNGEPCEYDQACSSGICCNGVCSNSCETTTVPSGGGGGSGAAGGSTGGTSAGGSIGEVVTCESDFSIEVPAVITGEIGETVTIPVTMNVEKVTCPPLTVSIKLDAPPGWNDETKTLEGLEEGDVKKVSFDLVIPNVSEGIYTLKIKADDVVKYIDIYAKKPTEEKVEEETTTNETITLPSEEIPRTGFVFSITHEPLTVIGIIICIVILYFLYRKKMKKSK